MHRNHIGLIVKLAAAIVAIGAAVCLVIIYSNEIFSFLASAKEKVKEKLPSGCCCRDDDDFSDFADM